jgi:hypothetical protein
MTLEVNEIGIRMRVHDGSQADGFPAELGATAKESVNREEIVEACVRQVLRVLRTLRER